MFQVYQEMGLFKNQEDRQVFWKRSEFAKKRNQLAAGMSLIEHLAMFQQAYHKLRKDNKLLTEQQFLNHFLQVFIQKAPQIMEWEKKFNSERQKQFLKNAPGLTQIKRSTMSDVLKQTPLITQAQIESQVKKLGLKGLNVSDRHYYHRTQQVWCKMKLLLVQKKLAHPTINMNLDEKYKLQSEYKVLEKQINILGGQIQQDVEQYSRLYEKQLL